MENIDNLLDRLQSTPTEDIDVIETLIEVTEYIRDLKEENRKLKNALNRHILLNR